MTDLSEAQRAELLAVAERVMPAVNAAEDACSEAVTSIVAAHAGSGRHVIQATESEWKASQDAFDGRDDFYAAMMPTERDAIRILNSAFERLKSLGWREAVYCPKDGSHFDAIEVGSTGIQNTAYIGEWPDGMWLIDGDSPSRPILYRPTEAERARWSALRARATQGQTHD